MLDVNINASQKVESAVAGTFFADLLSPATKAVDECWEVVQSISFLTI
jgi:hypothetical protein